METSFQALTQLVDTDTNVVALTGAGISVQSGIPPYRDHLGNWLGSEPIQHQEFVDDASKRQRYWARSAAGWPAVAAAEPNSAHHALVNLERSGIISLLVTQNVDRLHQRAGHRNVVDLHGRLDNVNCLVCQTEYARGLIQQELIESNPFLNDLEAVLAPDGDAAVADDLVSRVRVPACRSCGGVLMPDVVFFGGAVPQERVSQVTRAIESCDVLMIVGSSLMVYSGYRFCRLASTLGKPVIALNKGKTRADDMLAVKIEEDCAMTLANLEARLESRSVSH